VGAGRKGGVKFCKTKETAISKLASEDDVLIAFSKQKVQFIESFSLKGRKYMQNSTWVFWIGY
jgi:hypothetical protein